MSYNLEAQEVVVFEVKEIIPATEPDKKPSQRSLGFAESGDEADAIAANLNHEVKIVEKTVLRIREKGSSDAGKLVIQGRTFNFIFFVPDCASIPLEQYQSYSKDQQRFLGLLSG